MWIGWCHCHFARNTNVKVVWSKFKINSSGKLCCNNKFALFFFQENVSSSQSVRFFSRFAVVSLHFDYSMHFKIPRTHLSVSLIEPQFFSNTLGDLDWNALFPTAMALFLKIARPAYRKICKITLVFAVNSSGTILGHSGPLNVILSVDVVSSFSYLT